VTVLTLLASMASGGIVGVGVGSVMGYIRGHADGVGAGVEMERRAADGWRDLCLRSDYATGIPHGQVDHVCSSRCFPGWW
jgi:hypothetical protein